MFTAHFTRSRLAHPGLSRKDRSPRRRPDRLIEVEPLPNRVLPAVYVMGGDLVIDGTAGHDSVQVSRGSRFLFVNDNGKTTNIAASSVTGRIRFNGFDGNDSFVNWTAVGTTAFGGPGHDTLMGGSGMDFLNGDDGDDYLYGNLGEDYLFGGFGNDALYAGNVANDLSYNFLNGGPGDDALRGSEGPDYILGEDGRDTVYAYGGDDYVYTGAGDDVIYGGGGNDSLYGGAGRDWIYGEAGVDLLDGGADNRDDILTGGLGADRFRADYVEFWTVYPPFYNRWHVPPQDYNAAEGDSIIYY